MPLRDVGHNEDDDNQVESIHQLGSGFHEDCRGTSVSLKDVDDPGSGGDTHIHLTTEKDKVIITTRLRDEVEDHDVIDVGDLDGASPEPYDPGQYDISEEAAEAFRFTMNDDL